MRRKRGINSNQKSITDTPFGDEFLEKYMPALISVCNAVRKAKPDYILALSRKGPRLLELLRLLGIWSEDVPIISEKAIDFMPRKQLEGKKIVVFDDIIISGTTIKKLLSSLATKYNAELGLVCLAIDKDTIALEKDANDNYSVILVNGERVHLNYKVPLRREERFVFCNEIVRSFVFLNKSYDTDYPIFYTTVATETMFSLLAQGTLDKAYNLTSIHQRKHGYRRYTCLPARDLIVKGLISKIFQNNYLHPKICKTRVYLNEKSKETALVPIVTFEIKRRLLEKGEIFSDSFSYYNDLINQARDFIDPQEAAKAVYRLVWYIVSYLYGLAFNQRKFPKDDYLIRCPPSQLLDHQDLFYLFGPSLTQVILDFLDSYYTKTLRELKEIQCAKSNESREKSETPAVLTRSSFDERRENMYNAIKAYLETNLRVEDALTNQMARISEGLYYSMEIPTEENVRKLGMKGGEEKRLEVGFNYDQLKEILHRHQAISGHSDEVNLRVSLALDLLVDAGIQIPIFYYEREDGYFERVYRFGEDALSAKKYGYVVASAMRSLFDYMKTQHKRKTLPKIAFEKIGVIFQEEIGRSGLVDILEDPIDPDDRELRISPEFGRHGRILHLSDEAYEKSRWYPYMFTEWCTQEGIIRSVKGGVRYSSDFDQKLKSRSGHSPKLVLTDKIARFKSLAILLYHVDRVIDERGESEYLIALTTCGDQESYLRALRTELQLFFKSKEYSFSLVIEKVNEILKKRRSKNVLKEALQLLSQKSRSAANATRQKRKLWDDLPRIIRKVEEYFGKSDIELSVLYESHLKVHIDTIRATHDLLVESDISELREKIESLGELSIYLSSILVTLLDLPVQMNEMRMTKTGFHEVDLATMNYILINLRTNIATWNEYTKNQRVLDFWGLSVGGLPKISSVSNFTRVNYTVRDCDELMERIVPEVYDAYCKLEHIYNSNYSLPNWKGKLKMFFSKGEDLESFGIRRALEAARKCEPEDDKIHPKVGAVLVKNKQIVCEAHRGEMGAGDHAEYVALIKKCKKVDLTGATLITTLEPCTNRTHDKKPCAMHIVDKGIKKVIMGMIDPNAEIRGKGALYLQQNNIEVRLFPYLYAQEAIRINKDFWEGEMRKYKIDLMKD